MDIKGREETYFWYKSAFILFSPPFTSFFQHLSFNFHPVCAHESAEM